MEDFIDCEGLCGYPAANIGKVLTRYSKARASIAPSPPKDTQLNARKLDSQCFSGR
jgi:hypothetical protein